MVNDLTIDWDGQYWDGLIEEMLVCKMSVGTIIFDIFQVWL